MLCVIRLQSLGLNNREQVHDSETGSDKVAVTSDVVEVAQSENM